MLLACLKIDLSDPQEKVKESLIKKSWGQRNLKSKSESTTYKIQLNKGYIEVIMVLVNNNWTCFTCKLTLSKSIKVIDFVGVKLQKTGMWWWWWWWWWWWDGVLMWLH